MTQRVFRWPPRRWKDSAHTVATAMKPRSNLSSVHASTRQRASGRACIFISGPAMVHRRVLLRAPDPTGVPLTVLCHEFGAHRFRAVPFRPDPLVRGGGAWPRFAAEGLSA